MLKESRVSIVEDDPQVREDLVSVSGTFSLAPSVSGGTGGSVACVEFYCDSSVYLGAVSNAPYRMTHNSTNMGNGIRTFYATAYVSTDNPTNSASVTVKVSTLLSTSGLWAKSFGRVADYDNGMAVTVDGSGNVVATGNLQGIVTLGAHLLSTMGSYNMFVAKHSSSGSLLWAKQYGGTKSWTPKSVTLRFRLETVTREAKSASLAWSLRRGALTL